MDDQEDQGPEPLHYCPHKDHWMPLSSFGWRDRKHTRRQSWCWPCRQEYNSAYHKTNREALNARKNRNNRYRAARKKLQAKLDALKAAGIPPDPATLALQRHLAYQKRKQIGRKRWNRECSDWRKKNKQRQKEYQRRVSERRQAGLLPSQQPPSRPLPPLTARLHYAPATTSQPPAVLVWPSGAQSPAYRAATEAEARAWAAAHGFTLPSDPS